MLLAGDPGLWVRGRHLVQGLRHHLGQLRPILGSWGPASALLFTQLAVNVYPSAWVPAMHVGGLVGIPNPWFHPGPEAALGVIWGVNQRIKDFSLCLSSKYK